MSSAEKTSANSSRSRIASVPFGHTVHATLRRNLSQPHCRSDTDTLPEQNIGLHRHNQAVKADVTLSPRLSQ
ncbi:hypothetical protein ADL01_16935 [Streptomyces sp. NRRL WC-3618]|uniref:hypothetical protein n=1 Tax=unclassified Streptomyces TaxID=2593676 RepID=UPI0006B02A54|nr:hypothetical protein [Streptomyces sp. NRRL WC-3618]KOV75860.1 hypothetical protein ADL01_16935 [Streptomyces sp. NRRL WC-3618]